jgi:aldose 1-epimerase
MIGERTIDGILTLTLSSGGINGLEVAFATGAGMVGCSLLHRGEELIGQRGGLRKYSHEHSTMGIPLLYPWANRLGRSRFSVGDREVDLELDGLPLSFDPAGLPIHGLLSAAPGWEVERHQADRNGGLLEARFDFGAHPELVAAFPFPHELLLAATLNDAVLTITTTVRATGSPVPVSFGFHPYLRLPRLERRDWRLELPVRERLELDTEMLPTGQRRPVEITPGRLGLRTFDDGYLAPPDEAPFVLAGGGRRIEVRIGDGYRFAQVYAPADDDVVAFEPMSAPTNALVSAGPDLPLVEPGASFAATFSITVLDEAEYQPPR